MSALLWSQLPFLPQPNKDDELLVVNADEESRRISVKNLIFNQLAELTWTVSGTQNEGIGTANVWGNLLFNGLSGPDWIQLNGDGTWVLDAGIYVIETQFSCAATNITRYRLFNQSDSTTLIYRSKFTQNNTNVNAEFTLKKKVSITAQKTFALQVNVQSPYSSAFYNLSGALSGFNPVIAQAFIWRLG